jgi:hypothetical protein
VRAREEIVSLAHAITVHASHPATTNTSSTVAIVTAVTPTPSMNCPALSAADTTRSTARPTLTRSI